MQSCLPYWFVSSLGTLARALSLDDTEAAFARCEIRKERKIRRRVSIVKAEIPPHWHWHSGIGRQPNASGAALPSEGGLSRLRSGGTPASLLSSRCHSCRSIRGPGLLGGRAEGMPQAH